MVVVRTNQRSGGPPRGSSAAVLQTIAVYQGIEYGATSTHANASAKGAETVSGVSGGSCGGSAG